MAEYEVVTLKCWGCGAEKHVGVSRPFAFELVMAAESVGMVGKLDFERQRTLVFCSDDCADKQRTKGGRFRMRPKRSE
jgi:hypothetical protein